MSADFNIPLATSAPVPPGALGQVAPPKHVQTYLSALSEWVDQRRGELDDIEATMVEPGHFTADIAVAGILWHAVNDRLQTLLLLWNGGRADSVARRQMSGVLWARFGSESGGRDLPVNVADATALCDAMTGSAWSRLADPAVKPGAVADNVRGLLARIRDYVIYVPEHAQRVAEVIHQADAVIPHAPGPLDPAALDPSRLQQLADTVQRCERDLIVSIAGWLHSETTEHRDEPLRPDQLHASQELAAVRERQRQVIDVVARARAEVMPVPRLAVPDVGALGAVPADDAEVVAYIAHLRDVARAFDIVQEKYTAPLREKDDLLNLYDEIRAELSDRLSESAVHETISRAQALLSTKPCDLQGAREAVHACRQLLVIDDASPLGAHS